MVEKDFAILEKYYSNTKAKDLVTYYKDNWLGKLIEGLIDYSSVDDDIRTNSLLEQYHSHIKNLIPRTPSWPKFVEFLINEEADYVKTAFLAEQKGNIATKSVKLASTYLPKAVKRTLKTGNQRFTQDNHNDQNKSPENLKKRRSDEAQSETLKNQPPSLKKAKTESIQEALNTVNRFDIRYP